MAKANQTHLGSVNLAELNRSGHFDGSRYPVQIRVMSTGHDRNVYQSNQPFSSALKALVRLLAHQAAQELARATPAEPYAANARHGPAFYCDELQIQTVASTANGDQEHELARQEGEGEDRTALGDPRGRQGLPSV